tara:strand:+ start:4602 stop:5450 length:849 start_codon:yes stop_codon:yes gene_type:complete
MDDSQPISKMISNNKDISNESSNDDVINTTISNKSNEVEEPDIDNTQKSDGQDGVDQDSNVDSDVDDVEQVDVDGVDHVDDVDNVDNDNIDNVDDDNVDNVDDIEEDLDSDDTEDELDDIVETNDDLDKETSINPTTKVKEPQIFISDDDESDDEDEDYLQKFEQEIHTNFINDYHPEASAHNYEEVLTLSKIIKSESGAIIDPLHRTLPILSKYEKTRIIGQRAKQLEVGAKPFIDVPDGINRGITIAEMELKAKKIPFIIRRPLPNNGFEYWKVEDLEII